MSVFFSLLFFNLKSHQQFVGKRLTEYNIPLLLPLPLQCTDRRRLCLLCFVEQVTKDLMVFLFHGSFKPNKILKQQHGYAVDLHIEFRVRFDSMHVWAADWCERQWWYFASGCFYFIIRCSLHFFARFGLFFVRQKKLLLCLDRNEK